MGYGSQTSAGNRIKAMVAVGAVHVLFAATLLFGLKYVPVELSADGLNVIAITQAPPPEPKSEPPKAEKQDKREEAAAGAPAKKAEPTPVVAPPPKVVIPKVNPVVAAPDPGKGNAPKPGAAEVDGSGTGAVGRGDGRGSGLGGDGTGGGGVAVKARLKSGTITRKDYPRAAKQAKAGGATTVHFTVGRDGRVSNCRVRKSSGRQDLDETTCRLIEQRFRYEPARDRNGNPVSYVTGWVQDWWLERSGRRVTN